MSVLKVVLHLQLPNDPSDVWPVRAAVRADRNRPAWAVVASEPRSNHPSAVHVRDLAAQIRNRFDSLQNHLSQLLSGAGGFGHVQAPV